MVRLHSVTMQTFLGASYKDHNSPHCIHIPVSILVISTGETSRLHFPGYIFHAWHFVQALRYVFISSYNRVSIFTSTVPTAAAFNDGVGGCSNIWS